MNRQAAIDPLATAFKHVHKACGIFLHASLAESQDGLPIGLTGVEFWSGDALLQIGLARMMASMQHYARAVDKRTETNQDRPPAQFNWQSVMIAVLH